MYKQTNAICKTKRIRLFTLIINCTILMKTNSRFSRNVYTISDRIWCNKHLRHTNTMYVEVIIHSSIQATPQCVLKHIRPTHSITISPLGLEWNYIPYHPEGWKETMYHFTQMVGMKWGAISPSRLEWNYVLYHPKGWMETMYHMTQMVGMNLCTISHRGLDDNYVPYHSKDIKVIITFRVIKMACEDTDVWKSWCCAEDMNYVLNFYENFTFLPIMFLLV